MARAASAARRKLGWRRREFRALLRARGPRRTLFVRFADRREIERIAMRWQTNQVWHCYLPESRPGLLYGYAPLNPAEH